jgi:enoyl-CoA hydratase/carnithine racemase
VSSYKRLIVEKSDGVGWLILNRPEAGNAFDALMLDELEAAWAELDTDRDVHVIVATANGRAFCTGMDVVQVARDKAAMRKHSRRTRDAELKISSWHCDVWKPVIAAVNGVCAGGGLHLVADADIVIAAEEASFIDPHVSVGQAVAYEAITLLRKSPMEAITRMALSGKGERISARRAYELGIVSDVLPAGRLRAAAGRLAAAVATNSPTAMRATKKALWNSLEVGLSEARTAANTEIWRLRNHPDHAEGARAWREKRPARWQPLDCAEEVS